MRNIFRLKHFSPQVFLHQIQLLEGRGAKWCLKKKLAHGLGEKNFNVVLGIITDISQQRALLHPKMFKMMFLKRQVLFYKVYASRSKECVSRLKGYRIECYTGV